MNKAEPRCPKGALAKQVCVTEKCIASPFICQACPQAACETAHRYCKTMRWSSVYQMLQDYRKAMPTHYVAFMKRVEKIYSTLQQKITREIQLFRQHIEDQILSPEYLKLMHYLHVDQHQKITCKALSTTLQAMTCRPPEIKAAEAEKFTLGEMKTLDNSITNFLKGIEDLYLHKFSLLQKQVKQQTRKNTSNHHHARSFTLTQSAYNKNQSPVSPTLPRKMSQTTLAQSKGFHPISQLQKKGLILLKQTNYRSVETNRPNNNNFLASSQIIQRPRRASKQDLDYPKHISSLIIQNATVINHLLGKKVRQYKLVYRGSQSQFSIQNFYKKMANISYNRQQQSSITSLILVKTQYGKILGGCTALRWSRDSCLNTAQLLEEEQEISQFSENNKNTINYRQDVKGGTFLFSLNLNQRYELITPTYAIYCGTKSIGFGRKDLRLGNNANKHCKNYVGFPDSFNNGNYLPIKKSSLMLTGSKDSCYVRVSEWEAFEIVFQ